MTGEQGEGSLGIDFVMIAVVVVTVPSLVSDMFDHRSVLRGQEVQLTRLFGQALQAQGAALGPAAFLGGLLFFGFEIDIPKLIDSPKARSGETFPSWAFCLAFPVHGPTTPAPSRRAPTPASAARHPPDSAQGSVQAFPGVAQRTVGTPWRPRRSRFFPPASLFPGSGQGPFLAVIFRAIARARYQRSRPIPGSMRSNTQSSGEAEASTSPSSASTTIDRLSR